MTAPVGAPPGTAETTPSGHRRPSSLALRIIGIAVLVAILVAGIAGAVAVEAVQRTAREANAARLEQQADLLQVELARSPDTDRARRRLLTVLAGQGFLVVTYDESGVLTDDATAAAVVEAAGLPAAKTPMAQARLVRLAGTDWLVSARAITGSGTSFAVVADAREGAVSTRLLLRRVLLALLIGLGVAIPAGLVLARLVTRPLRRTVDLAHAMAAGRRDLRVASAGPAEVREVGTALNRLADALADSESRQQQFLASVSHELRTPLAAVAGLADALADGLVSAPEVPGIGGTIRVEAARLERLVADLLDLARLRTSEFGLDIGAVDLQATVAAMSTVWQVRAARRSVDLVIATDEEPTIVSVDERRLRQVLDGLAENALRVLQPGGSLLIRAGRLGSGPGGRAFVEIRDSGPGLTADDYRDALEPGVLHQRYRSTRPVGAGLGLMLANGLVSRMGGILTLSPAPEGGVCAAVTFPVSVSEQVEAIS